jgi:hypothetical protein
MNALVIDGSGHIIDVRGPIGREDSGELIDLTVMMGVTTDTTMENDGVMMRKIANTG